MKVTDVVIQIAPEMQSLDQNDLNFWVDLGSSQTNLSCGNDTINALAKAYLTAHMYTMSQRSGSGGAVQSLKEGDLSITYAINTKSYPFEATSYGQEYMRLVKTYSLGARNIFVGSTACQ